MAHKRHTARWEQEDHFLACPSTEEWDFRVWDVCFAARAWDAARAGEGHGCPNTLGPPEEMQVDLQSPLLSSS